MDVQRLARGLGWFSIALGGTQLAAPQTIERVLGVEQHGMLLRALGVRELGPGMLILAQNAPARWLWARVAGDIMDLGLLAAAWDESTQRRAVLGAAGAVAAVLVLDVICAQQLNR